MLHSFLGVSEGRRMVEWPVGKSLSERINGTEGGGGGNTHV